MSVQYDVIVIGAGPAGYIAAIRCAQLGLSTACVDDWVNKQGEPVLGGTCLNVGCIPSKALLESSQKYEDLLLCGEQHGINVNAASFDVSAMVGRKDSIVSELTSGIEQLFKANKVTWLKGRGKLLVNHQVEVIAQDNQKNIYKASSVILATGSSPVELPFAAFVDDKIVDSAGALDWEYVPKTLGIIGAGVIGLELGSVWRRLGSKVVILEAMDGFLATTDKQIATTASRLFKKQGLDIHLGAKVKETVVTNQGISLSYTDNDGDKTLEVDNLIVAVGRRPNSHDIADSSVGLVINDHGFVDVNDHCETAIPDIYAIGDLVRGPMLAHKASEEGVMVAEQIAGQQPQMNYDAIPNVIYTHPEIAWVGKTEEELKKEEVPYRVGTFPFAANGRAKAMSSQDGQVKVLAHAKTDRLLGVHIVGPHASELIGQAVVAMECEATAEDLARTVTAHPTLSESLREAALAVDGRALHSINRKR